MDIVLSLSALAFCAPLLLLIALLVFLESPGGVLFRQPRAGFNNQPFTMLKFRTTIAEAPGQQAGNPRATRLGRFLRRCGLDELPQLLNVLGGSMSVVGPRPRAAAPHCSPRHRMKPGLTGWAQVNEARDGIHGPEEAARAAALDLDYARRWSIWLDIRIVLRTIGMVLSGRGAP